MRPEIDVRGGLLPRHVTALDTLRALGGLYDAGQWVLVGGMMVMLLGLEHGVRAPRAEGTKDADIVVDLLTKPHMLEDVTSFLNSQGYGLQDIPGAAAKVGRCTFRFHDAVIDVLCPDGTPDEHLLVEHRNIASIAIPGGRRAIETARPVSLYYTDDGPDAEVHMPTLAGAIAVKTAAAVDPRTRTTPRHLEDVAFLLTLDVDATETKRGLNEADIELLRQIEQEATSQQSLMWRSFRGDAQVFGIATYQLLVS